MADKKEQKQDEIVFEKVLQIKRITKVTTGGKKLSFSALVVVGNGKGKIGFALAKAGEVVGAIRKALMKAKREMVYLPIKGNTIPHDVVGEFSSAKVVMKPASRGTGIIAGEVVRAICEAAGIQDILTKSLKSNRPVNLLKAALDGFSKMRLVPAWEIGKVDVNDESVENKEDDTDAKKETETVES